jgi:hypothetical protein
MMGDRSLSRMRINTAYMDNQCWRRIGLCADWGETHNGLESSWAGSGVRALPPGQEIKYRTYVNWLICPYLSNSALKACANSATPCGVSSPYLPNQPQIASIDCEAATMTSAISDWEQVQFATRHKNTGDGAWSFLPRW